MGTLHCPAGLAQGAAGRPILRAHCSSVNELFDWFYMNIISPVHHTNLIIKVMLRFSF
jgi:hypothetical protein